MCLQCGLHLLPNPNALVAVSKGMRAVKLCTNEILRLTCIIVVKSVVVVVVFVLNGCIDIVI